MKKIVFITQLTFSLYAITINDIQGKWICNSYKTNSSLLKKYKYNIKRTINIKTKKITIKDNLYIKYCLKPFIIFGKEKCYPRWKGTINITGNYNFKNNKISITIENIKFKEDTKFKKNYMEKMNYNNCSELGKLSKYCYKSKNIFLKYWNKTFNKVKKIYNKNIKIEYLNSEFEMKDKTLDTKFECEFKE